MNKMNDQRDSERMDTSHIPDAVKQQMKLHPELYPTLLDLETAKKILKESDLMKTK
jgi:hypothetical protein